jgi:hypothetical protein
VTAWMVKDQSNYDHPMAVAAGRLSDTLCAVEEGSPNNPSNRRPRPVIATPSSFPGNTSATGRPT